MKNATNNNDALFSYNNTPWSVSLLFQRQLGCDLNTEHVSLSNIVHISNVDLMQSKQISVSYKQYSNITKKESGFSDQSEESIQQLWQNRIHWRTAFCPKV